MQAQTPHQKSVRVGSSHETMASTWSCVGSQFDLHTLFLVLNALGTKRSDHCKQEWATSALVRGRLDQEESVGPHLLATKLRKLMVVFCKLSASLSAAVDPSMGSSLAVMTLPAIMVVMRSAEAVLRVDRNPSPDPDLDRVGLPLDESALDERRCRDDPLGEPG